MPHIPWFVRLSLCLCVWHKVNCAKTDEPIEIPFGGRLVRGQKHVLDRDAYRRHLANVIERYVCGGDAVLESAFPRLSAV